MKSKTLALIFIASMVAAFALTTIGDNSGNKGMFWLGIVSLSVMIVSGVMWWKQQDQE